MADLASWQPATPPASPGSGDVRPWSQAHAYTNPAGGDLTQWVAAAAAYRLALTQLAGDNFNRANGPLAGSGGWAATSEPGTVTISNNEAAGAAAAVQAGAYRIGEIYNSDQYAQMAVGSVAQAAGDYIGLSVRNQDNANNYTGIYWNNGGTFELVLFKKVAGVFTQIAVSTAPAGAPYAAGTVIVLTAEGPQITLTALGAIPAGVSVSDATFTGGAPGLELDGTNSLDNWTAGNAHTAALTAAAASDDFNRANGGVSAGQANWQVMAYSPAVGATLDAPIVTNQISYATPTVHGGDTRLDAFHADHWASIQQGTVAMTASGFAGVTTRNQAGGRSCYLGSFFNNNSYLIHRLDGTGAPGTDASHLLAGVATPGNDPAGTVYTLVSQGSRHSFRVNGREVLAVTDATYAGGTPGLMMFATASADNWTAGNL